MKYPAAELRGILAYFDKYESLLPLPDGEKVEVRLDHFKYLWLDLIGI
jgi:hypothetical protein